MRRRELQRRKRNELAWYLLGFLVAQAALAVGLERLWPAVRDPDFGALQQVVRARRAEAPARPLVVALGSSRTLMALRAGLLNHPDDPEAPLVINAAIAGGGPMMDHVVLRRLSRAGVRPDLVVIEAMPLALSRREGAPIEERQPYAARFSVAEAVRLDGYYAEPHRLWGRWGLARVAPIYSHRAELRDALGVDRPATDGSALRGRDAHGWIGCPRDFSPAEVAAETRNALETYEVALTEPAVAPGAVQALRDLLQRCRADGLPALLVVPPEGAAFRSFAPTVAEQHMAAMQALAREANVPLIDARTWVDESGFYDGHHVTRRGAAQYTERFGREVLAPHLPSRQARAARR